MNANAIFFNIAVILLCSLDRDHSRSSSNDSNQSKKFPRWEKHVLRQARRFCFRVRYPLYVAAATSRRTLQLIEAFPALAVAIFCTPYFRSDRQAKAREMVQRGESLRQIAALMKLPWALKRVKPGRLTWRSIRLA
jgi:hypothetical protein